MVYPSRSHAPQLRTMHSQRVPQLPTSTSTANVEVKQPHINKMAQESASRLVKKVEENHPSIQSKLAKGKKVIRTGKQAIRTGKEAYATGKEVYKTGKSVYKHGRGVFKNGVKVARGVASIGRDVLSLVAN
jgi:hypothetical protein